MSFLRLPLQHLLDSFLVPIPSPVCVHIFSFLWRNVRFFTLDFTDPRGAPEAMTKDTSRFAHCDTDFVVRLERECLRVFVAVSLPPAVSGSWSALFANLQLLTMVGLHCQVDIRTCQAHHAVVG